MEWGSFTLGDLVQLCVILVGILTAYWTLASRVTLVEDKLRTMEVQARENENKIEAKLDTLSNKIDKLIVEVTTLKAQRNN